MKQNNKYIESFYALVNAGLWGKKLPLATYGEIDFSEIYRFAEEQVVMGLVTAGLEKVRDIKIPQRYVLQFVGSTLQIEQRNKDMNDFVARLIEVLREKGVYALLVKGQGVAQCYEKPLWRSCGDVDLLLSCDNYVKAKDVLVPLASKAEDEDKRRLHFGMTIEDWIVELHGSLITGISRSLNKVVRKVQESIFYGGEVRSWNNNAGTQVFLPSPDNDVFLIISHILEHFYVYDRYVICAGFYGNTGVP